MTSLGRSLSFSRRRKGPSRPAFSPEKERPEKTEKAENAQEGTRMQKIIRSASFGRRGSKAKENKGNTKRDDPPTAGEESTSGDSRPLTPEEAEEAEKEPISPEEKVLQPRRESLELAMKAHEMTDEELDAIPLSANLQGFLKKRHQKQPHQWARRFFFVNDERGTVAYSKGEKGKRLKPSVVLSLQDISTVKLLTLDDARFPLLICCPPVSLTIAAEDREEALMWVIQLNKRMRIWREKAALKTRVATPAPPPPPSLPSPPGTATDGPATCESREEKLEPRDPVMESDRRRGSSPPERRGSGEIPHPMRANGYGSSPPATAAAPDNRALQQYAPAVEQQQYWEQEGRERLSSAVAKREAKARGQSEEITMEEALRGSPAAVGGRAVRQARDMMTLGKTPDNTSVETIDFVVGSES